MKAIVTGGTGFIGKWLVEELLNQGDEVTLIVRNDNVVPRHLRERVYIIQASLEDLKQLKKENFPESKADVFFHMAWAGTSGIERANVELQLKNVQYTCEAVRVATMMNCDKFVNAGSIMEYEAISYIDKAGSIPGMGYIYSIAKMTADFMAKTIAINEKISYINLIISNIYGVGEKSARFFNTTMKKMIKNEEILLTSGEQLYDFIYVEDAVKAIVLVAKKGERDSAYYIGNETQRSLKEYILEMYSVLESNAKLRFGEIPFTGTMLNYKEFDTTGLKRLGFSPNISFAEGIRKTQIWMDEVEDEF